MTDQQQDELTRLSDALVARTASAQRHVAALRVPDARPVPQSLAGRVGDEGLGPGLSQSFRSEPLALRWKNGDSAGRRPRSRHQYCRAPFPTRRGDRIAPSGGAAPRRPRPAACRRPRRRAAGPAGDPALAGTGLAQLAGQPDRSADRSRHGAVGRRGGRTCLRCDGKAPRHVDCGSARARSGNPSRDGRAGTARVAGHQ